MRTDDDERATLAQARQRCERLVEQLRGDARSLERPSRRVAPEAMAEGRAAYQHAAAAAEALLRELSDELHRL
jgi:hypothetical protein